MLSNKIKKNEKNPVWTKFQLHSNCNKNKPVNYPNKATNKIKLKKAFNSETLSSAGAIR